MGTTGTNTNDGESSAGMSTNLAQNDDSIVELTEESREEEVAELEQKTVNPKKDDELVVENESTAEEQQKDSVVENETVVEERQEVVFEDSQEEDKESVGGASTNCTQYFLSTTPEDYSKVFSKNGTNGSTLTQKIPLTRVAPFCSTPDKSGCYPASIKQEALPQFSIGNLIPSASPSNSQPFSP